MHEAGEQRIKASDIKRLLADQNYRCAYTGEPLTPVNVTADHCESLARGGSHTLANIRLVTADVNRAKNTMPLNEFVELCRKVVAHHDGTSAPRVPVEDLEREWLA